MLGLQHLRGAGRCGCRPLQVPKIGAELAEAILKEYPTPHALREAYLKAGSRPAARALLAGIKVGELRTVGPVAAGNVFDLLFGNSMYLAAG